VKAGLSKSVVQTDLNGKMLSTIYGALMVPKLAETLRNDENIEENLMSISGIDPGTIGSGAQHSPSYTIRAPPIREGSFIMLHYKNIGI
jgi:hypothetical protein